MEPNPYQAPADFGSLATPGKLAGAFYREGKYLVVNSGVVLPPFCVKTGEPVSEEEMETRTVTWSPLYVLVLILFSLLIGLIVYFVVRKKCEVTYGLSASIRRKNRDRRLIALGLAAVCFLGMIIAASFDSALIALGCMVLFITAIVIAIYPGRVFSVHKYEYQQEEFWLKGCSPEFLALIE